MRAVVLLLLCGNAVAASESETPLFDYARELPFVSVYTERSLSRELAQAHYAIEHNPPPKENCSRTLGANLFASMYDNLASVQATLGDSGGAIENFRKSLACNPRDPGVRAALASALMHIDRIAEARAEAERGRAIDPEDAASSSTLMQLDFIEGRWPQVIARLREMLGWTSDVERATYWECFLWLAQRRSGIREPDDSASDLTDDWPRPVLEALRGALTENDVLDVLREEGNDRRQREMLCEALYYIGQTRLANGDTENARLYFTAAVNLKVMYFIEHHLALAELTKMLAQSP